MKEISIFLANNYIWFVIVDVLLLFALIGFLFEGKKKKNLNETEVLDTIKLDDSQTEILEQLVLDDDMANKSLNSVVNKADTNKDSDTEVLNDKTQ